MMDDVIEIKPAAPDSQFRLLPCKKCQSDNVAYVHYNGRGGAGPGMITTGSWICGAVVSLPGGGLSPSGSGKRISRKSRRG